MDFLRVRTTEPSKSCITHRDFPELHDEKLMRAYYERFMCGSITLKELAEQIGCKPFSIRDTWRKRYGWSIAAAIAPPATPARTGTARSRLRAQIALQNATQSMPGDSENEGPDYYENNNRSLN
jgi:uncharacterized protein YjcR